MNCPACDDEVEARAEKCPHCGFPVGQLQLVQSVTPRIWAAMTVSVLVYAVIIVTVPGKVQAPSTVRFMEEALGGMAALQAGAVIFWPQSALALTAPWARLSLLVPATLAVVPAVFGLILRFMGAPQAHALIFCGASLALMALLGTRLPGQIQAVRRHLIDNWNKPE